ncbi:hypothetical protein [Actinomadura sp. HBU206391]|uniref:hypothetical protein n=1 Tax=Actinomadura sp. HBU206391 TaxID=2731692 RepID=UPI0016501F49|nr:hypothetical protein [Actinomadura sp. HBU206391]MBC6458677.1 hypothetical protein [Actinomadura sp. HBU206391]
MKTSQSTAANTANPANTAAGLGRTGLGASTGQRLPVPPRERKPALAALAVLLILGGALTSAYLVMASGQRVSAIRIAQPVAAGQRIPADALEEVQIGNTGIEFISWTERGAVSQAYAAVPLVKGALLTNGMVSPTDAATNGRVVVGLALKPGQLPADGLKPGDRVSLYGVGGQNAAGVRAGTTLSEDAIVVDVARGGEQSLQSDQTMISIAVPPEEAPQVAQAASAGAVAVARVPVGTKVRGGATAPSGQTSGGQNPTGQNPNGQNPTGQTSDGPEPGGQNPSGRTPTPAGGG